ncbi:MAG: hypothetical protein ACJ762_02780 [Solirubrobacteraceae bacterium]
MKLRSLIVVAGTTAAFAAAAPSSMAAGVDLSVSGTTLGSLALTVSTPAVFATNFSPGNTASASGIVLATSTSPSWTLTAEDAGTGAGKMIAGAGACTGSDATLTNALKLTVNGAALTGSQSAGQKTLSATPQTVAQATTGSLLPIAAAPLTVAYSQVIPTSQVMTEGCIYSLTTTFTLS